MDVMSDLIDRLNAEQEATVYTVFPATGLIVENETPDYYLTPCNDTVYWEEGEPEPDWDMLAPGIEHYMFTQAEELPGILAPVIQRNAPFWVQSVQLDVLEGEGDDTQVSTEGFAILVRVR